MDRRQVLAWLVGLGAAAARVVGAQAPREIRVTARKYSYSPSRIEVTQNDLVKVTLEAADIPHSFTIDAYRIAKRASPGHGVTFEFRADQPGTFPIYCNIAEDEGCRNMRGELVVR
jgi:cytochrome c oxidase subunit 2